MINLLGAVLTKEAIGQLTDQQLEAWFQFLMLNPADLDLPFEGIHRSKFEVYFPIGFAIAHGLEQALIHLLRGGASHVALGVVLDHRNTAWLLECINREWKGTLPDSVKKAVKWRCRNNLARIHAGVQHGNIQPLYQGVIERVMERAEIFRYVMVFI